jgi:hypothetical protein
MAGRGQKRGGNANAQRQSLSSSGAGSSPSISSANATASVAVVSRAAYDPAVARRQANEKKYPLWKYVTKKQGQGSVSKASGGGNVTWNCNFCHGEYSSTYYRVKGHLLALPCGLGPCKVVSAEKRALMEIEDKVGLGNVAAKSNKQKNEDPLPFLRTPSSRFGSGFDMPTPKKRAASSLGPMDKIFQQE